MKKKLNGKWAVLVLALLLAFTACTSPAAKPMAPPEAQPETRALRFYEFYSPM